MDEILRFESVSKYFGSFCAVDSVSLQVFDGEFLAILGPSGSGKTTILRMIAGFERVSSGRMIYRGTEDIDGVPVNQRPFNTVFQDYALFPHMTVFQNVAYGLTIRREKRSEIRGRVAEALEMVDLADYGRRYPDQLSGGQRQRVALARSLILKPKILLLDEPLGALDLALRKKMQVTLKKIQEQVRITFVHVTHDQEEGLSMADRVAIVNRGRIEQIDTPRNIYHFPRTLFAARFMGENNIIEAQLDPALHDGMLRVRTAFGPVLSCAEKADGFRAGNGPVWIAVRPEEIAVDAEVGPEHDNVCEVYVRREIFTGSEVKLVVSPSSSHREEMLVKTRDDRRHGPGDLLRIGWSSASCQVLKREDAADDE